MAVEKRFVEELIEVASIADRKAPLGLTKAVVEGYAIMRAAQIRSHSDLVEEAAKAIEGQ